jgi:hypothetical protein
MGATGRKFVEAQHAPEAHYRALMRLYTQMRPWPRKARKITALPVTVPPLRVAFIGGRGMVSKYSGIETYYEEVGKRLVEMGHDVTVYCRSYFTPAQPKYEGMRLVRLPTFRSKHFETFVHTWLSTVHVMFSGCDIVHYHAQGRLIFVFPANGRKEDYRYGSGTRLAAKKVGTLCLAHSPPRRTRLRTAAESHHGRFPDSEAALPDHLWR